MRSRAVSRPARNIRSVVSVQRTIEKRFVALLGVVSWRSNAASSHRFDERTHGSDGQWARLRRQYDAKRRAAIRDDLHRGVRVLDVVTATVVSFLFQFEVQPNDREHSRPIRRLVRRARCLLRIERMARRDPAVLSALLTKRPDGVDRHSPQEQLKRLRGWMDNTRTFESTYSTTSSPYVVQMDCSVVGQDLYQTVADIDADFGQYLHHYALSHTQALIDKFQQACEVCGRRARDEFVMFCRAGVGPATFDARRFRALRELPHTTQSRIDRESTNDR